MKLSRRETLQAGAALGGAIALGGCARLAETAGGLVDAGLPADLSLPRASVHPTARLLNRAGFGPKPGEIAAVSAEGHEAYVERQLNAGDDEDMALKLQLGRIESLHEPGSELEDEPRPEMFRQLQQAALLRAVYGRHQLRERMVDLWTNHFNIYARKADGPYKVAGDGESVVRKHALGTFPAMLAASAHSPAMLEFLDNQVNRKGVANENYARELMELHTLGVHGGYTQKDVQEVARCFTGWGVEDRFLRRHGEFRFDPALHDDGPKTVLGHMIPAGGGESDGDQVLDILGGHPSTARFISMKLCRHFLGVTEGPWVDRTAETYLKSGGDIKEMLRPILLSGDLLDGPPLPKRPLDYVASAMRAVAAVSDCDQGVQDHLERMGQPLHQWPMPDGYPEKASAWTGSLLARWNFALALCEGRVPGTRVSLKDLFERTHAAPASAGAILAFGREASERDGVLKRESDPARIAALCLASPEFQWR